MRRGGVAVLGVVAVLALTSARTTVGATAGRTVDTLRIEAVSNRADLISGGGVLLRVTLPPGARVEDAALFRNGRQLDGVLHASPDGRGYLASVRGLRVGRNAVRASVLGAVAELEITNHPIGGPVFSGPQVQPWICQTESAGLGPARDKQCNTAPTFEFAYMPRGTGGLCVHGTDTPICPQFREYDPESPPPAELVETTTTDTGASVPFIVRVEKGVIDRGIYAIAALYQPGKPWEPWAPQSGFNGKLLYPFGGNCLPTHDQGPPLDVLNGIALARGFVVATSGLNILGQACNDVISAESLMMVKEHVVETYGPLRYTLSTGCSGGSMQQHWIVSNYPGLLDGILPGCSYPDIWQTMQEAEDCHLLDRYFDRGSPHLWAAAAQQAAVAGYLAPTTCRSLWDGPTDGMPAQTSFSRVWLDPDNAGGCTAEPSPSWVYNARTNRKGVRCTLPDYMVAVFGTRKSDGFANRPYDNVGVQYGLTAVQSGTILPEQFVDLNEKVGGIDIDWNWTPRRSVADAPALRIAYQSGRVTFPREAAKVPIIDLRGSSNLEIHTDFHSWTMRDRLIQANGHANNQVIWTTAPLVNPVAINRGFDVMDRWLAAIEADRGDDPLERKVVRNKPAEAVDACFVGPHEITDMATCRTLFPYYGDPRIAAGGPLADNVLKCRLRPLDRGEYNATFTAAQWARLQKAFPTGVCDWRTPGIAQQPSTPWLTFSRGPGGRPLGGPPTSRLR